MDKVYNFKDAHLKATEQMEDYANKWIEVLKDYVELSLAVEKAGFIVEHIDGKVELHPRSV